MEGTAKPIMNGKRITRRKDTGYSISRNGIVSGNADFPQTGKIALGLPSGIRQKPVPDLKTQIFSGPDSPFPEKLFPKTAIPL